MELLDYLFIGASWLLCGLILAVIVGRAIKLGNRQPKPPIPAQRPPWPVMHEVDPRRPMGRGK